MDDNVENNTNTEPSNTNENTNTQSNAEIPKTAADYIKVLGPDVAQYYGRKILYDDYLPEDINGADSNENAKKISDILLHIWSTHTQNANEIDYL